MNKNLENNTSDTLMKFMASASTLMVNKKKRIESIDLLRGIVMVIMALDHVRDYFHHDAFLYSPTDLRQTSVILFFTRFATHYCAPVFVFLAGISACLYGTKKSKRALTFYLFSRGSWLVFVELFIISFGLTFNPTFPMFNLQVIWAIGISMIVLSVMIYMNWYLILLTAIIFITTHNLLDSIHVPGAGVTALFWSLLHEDRDFVFGQLKILVHYPLLPWIGIIALGYCSGKLYGLHCTVAKRKKTFLVAGLAAIFLFILLRAFNVYGDVAFWVSQKNIAFTAMSFLNVSKYPPSLLYILITLGPALIFLALAEKPLNVLTEKVAVFGRVPFFYYVIHLYLIHLIAVFAAKFTGYSWSDMILNTRVNRTQELKGYGFGLSTVYFIWIALILFLYPFCKWFDRYKRIHQSTQWWLSYV